MNGTMKRTVEALSMDKFARLPHVKDAAAKVGQQPETLVFAVIAVFAVLCQLPIIGGLLIGLVSFVCPALETVSVLEQNRVAEFDRLLIYWLVFGVLSYFRSIERVLFWWLPGYDFVRLVLLMALYLPKVNGARILAAKLKGFMGGRQDTISALIEEGKRRMDRLCGVVAKKSE